MARRVFDVVVAGSALLVASPLLLAAVVAIRLESRGSAIYRQRRVGKDGRAFDVLKLRTMVTGAEHMGAGLAVSEGDTRITRIGRLLRRTSLDEMPNLINVLRGEMAIVGPRPTVPVQVGRYTERQRGRLAVKPGITGWAQVNGRTELPWDERIELDLWYIEHRSWLRDARSAARPGIEGKRPRGGATAGGRPQRRCATPENAGYYGSWPQESARWLLRLLAPKVSTLPQALPLSTRGRPSRARRGQPSVTGRDPPRSPEAAALPPPLKWARCAERSRWAEPPRSGEPLRWAERSRPESPRWAESRAPAVERSRWRAPPRPDSAPWAEPSRWAKPSRWAERSRWPESLRCEPPSRPKPWRCAPSRPPRRWEPSRRAWPSHAAPRRGPSPPNPS